MDLFVVPTIGFDLAYVLVCQTGIFHVKPYSRLTGNMQERSEPDVRPTVRGRS
jgi:hypothetical protein